MCPALRSAVTSKSVRDPIDVGRKRREGELGRGENDRGIVIAIRTIEGWLTRLKVNPDEKRRGTLDVFPWPSLLRVEGFAFCGI
jgi:hypothetical protein